LKVPAYFIRRITWTLIYVTESFPDKRIWINGWAQKIPFVRLKNGVKCSKIAVQPWTATLNEKFCVYAQYKKIMHRNYILTFWRWKQHGTELMKCCWCVVIFIQILILTIYQRSLICLSNHCQSCIFYSQYFFFCSFLIVHFHNIRE
jgi:hypothetical protein